MRRRIIASTDSVATAFATIAAVLGISTIAVILAAVVAIIAAQRSYGAEPMCRVLTDDSTPLAPGLESVPCSAVEQSCYAYALGAPVRCSWRKKPPRVRTEIICGRPSPGGHCQK